MGLWNMIKKSKKKKEESKITEPNVSAIDATSETICGNVVPTTGSSSTEREKNNNFQLTPKSSSNRTHNNYKTSQFSKKNDIDDNLSFPRSKSSKGTLQVFSDNIMTAETLDYVSSPESSKLQSNRAEDLSNNNSTSIAYKLNQLKIVDDSESEEETPFYVAATNLYKIPKASPKEIKPQETIQQEDSDDEFPSVNQSTSINNESIQRPPSPKILDLTTDRERIGSFQTDEESFANSTVPVIIPPSDSSQKLEESFIQEEQSHVEEVEQEILHSPVAYKKAINETEILNLENNEKELKEDIPIEKNIIVPEMGVDPEEPAYFDLNESNLHEHLTEEAISEPKFENKTDKFDFYLDEEAPELSSDEEDQEITEPQCLTEGNNDTGLDNQYIEETPIPHQTSKQSPKEDLNKKSPTKQLEVHSPEHDFSDEEQEDFRKNTNSPSQELAQLEHKELTMFLETELSKLKDDLKTDRQIAKGVASKKLSELPSPESLPITSQQQPISLTLNLDAKYKYARKALLRQYFKDRDSSKEKLTDELEKLGHPIDPNTSLKLERWDKENRELERLKASRRQYEKDLEKLEKLVEIEQMEYDVELAKTKSHVVLKSKQSDLKSNKGYSQMLYNKMELMGKTLVTSSDTVKEDEPEVLIKQISLLKSEREKYQSLVDKQKEVIKTLTEDLLTDGEFSPKEKLQIIDNIMRHAPILHSDPTVKDLYSPTQENITDQNDNQTQIGVNVQSLNRELKQDKIEKSKKKKTKKMKMKSGSSEDEEQQHALSKKKGIESNNNAEPKRSSTPKLKTTNTSMRPSSASSTMRRSSSSLSEPMNNSEKRKIIIRPTSPSLSKRPSSAAGRRKVTISLEPSSRSDTDRKKRPGSASSTRCDKIVDRLYEGGMEKQTRSREWASAQRQLQEAKKLQEMREKPILNRNSIEIINRKYQASENFRDVDSPLDSFKRNSGEYAIFELRPQSSVGSLEEMRLMRQDSRRRRVKEYHIMKESMAECTFTPNLSKKTNELVSQKRSNEEGQIYKKLYDEAKEKDEQNAKLRQVAVNMREEEEKKQLAKPKVWKNPEEEQAFINRMLEFEKIKQKKIEQLREKVYEKENPFKPQINHYDIENRSDVCEHLYKQGMEVQKRRLFIKEQYDQYLETVAATKHTNKESTKYIQNMKEKRLFSLFNLFCIESNSDNMQVGKLHNVIEPLLEKFGEPIALVVPLLEHKLPVKLRSKPELGRLGLSDKAPTKPN